jgi:hypothetical protein
MVRVTATGYVPFEPRTADQRATRARLRQAISELDARPGEILHATFAGTLPAGADVENALFYNLDGTGVFGSMSGGVSFEIDPTPTPGQVRYEYETGPVEANFRYWGDVRCLATFDAALDAIQPKLASIWWALRCGSGSIRTRSTARTPEEVFLMTLHVNGPARGLRPALLKTILDGTICALQSEADVVLAAAVAPRLATGLGVPADAVANALVDRSSSALGYRVRFVHPHGRGVKWEPDDDRCVAARVLFRRAEQWRIRGNAATASPRMPTDPKCATDC